MESETEESKIFLPPPPPGLVANYSEKELQSKLPVAWLIYWCVVWFGTTFAGSLFALFLGVMSASIQGLASMLGFGVVWAGGVGFAVIATFAAICWMFWIQKNPYVLAVVAGGLVGTICGLIVFSIVTGPLGAGGASLFVYGFLNKTDLRKAIVASELRRRQSGPAGDRSA